MLSLPELFRHLQAPERAHGNARNAKAKEHQKPFYLFLVWQVAYTAAVSPNTDMGASCDEADSSISSSPPSSVTARPSGPLGRKIVAFIEDAATQVEQHTTRLHDASAHADIAGNLLGEYDATRLVKYPSVERAAYSSPPLVVAPGDAPAGRPSLHHPANKQIVIDHRRS